MKLLFFVCSILALALAPSAAQAQESILQPSTDTSLAGKQERASKRVVMLAQSGYSQLARMQKQGIDLVWHNSEGLTPQQVCDALGTKAGKIFAIHAALTDALIAAQTADGVPVDVALPTNAFTVNPNGTVTILTTPYVPPSN